jgi:long-chain-fatty-acid--[acyl-carrier-protein] ligase
VIIYPSGQIARTPTEKINNKQSAYVVVSRLPEEVRVIGVRISGLWGSMWSAARTGEPPNFMLTYLKGIFYFFANLIFFLPKRDVTFEYVDITEEAKIKSMSERSAFNTYLEDFYNLNGPEKARHIRHLFYMPE